MKTNKKIFCVLLILYICFASINIFAQQSNPAPNSSGPFASSNTSSLSLKPPSTDLSVGYLSNMFGTVPGVLSGNTGQLLGNMFSVFNGAVLVLGGVVILYTLFISTLNTAHEGEMLGKRWSSIWIPLRSLIGIALLIPTTGGYSFIQIFMMWVAVMGVGAADSIWNKALDYFNSGGIIIQQNASLSGSSAVTGSSTVTTDALGLLRSMTCVAMLQRQLTDYRNSFQSSDPSQPAEVPNLLQDTMSAVNSANTAQSITVNFPTVTAAQSAVYSDLTGVCGQISWDPVTTTSGSTTIPSAQVGARTTAMMAMINNFYGVGQSIVNNFKTQAVNGTGGPLPLGTSMTVAGVQVWVGSASNLQQRYLLPGTTISDATNAYFGTMSAALNYANQGTQLANNLQWIQSAKDKGWVLAGDFYMDMIKINSVNVNLGENNPPYNYIAPADPSFSAVTNHFGVLKQNSPYVQDMETLMTSSNPPDIGNSSPFISTVVGYGNSITYGNLSSLPTTGTNTGDLGSDKINTVMGPVAGVGKYINQGLLDLAQSQQNNQNPIIALASLGNGLVNTGFWVFIGVAIATLTVGLLLGAAFGFAFAAGFAAMVNVILALLTPILIPLMVTGLTMLFYIPMIPFIIFTFGAIGWFIAVVEAIIAAPLVALGIAHPEGAEILGKAEPAVGLLVNVFLRPTFMIFGLIIGIMLSYVGIWILNQGIYNIFFGSASSSLSVTAQSSDVASSLFSNTAFLVIYVLIALQIVQKSFTLIYTIPDQVLLWIGINIRGMGGEAEAEGKIAGGFHGAAQAQAEQVNRGADVSKGMADAAAGMQKAKREGETGLVDKISGSGTSSS